MGKLYRTNKLFCSKTAFLAPLISFFLLFGIANSCLPQDFTDRLKAMLPKSYQSKLTKAESYFQAGMVSIEKGGAMPDSLVLAQSVTNDKGEKEVDNNYYLNRLEAAHNFINANRLTFVVLDKFIADFWKKFEGDKNSLALLIQVENAAYDSLFLADVLRAKAETKSIIKDKIQLVSTAENIEAKALFRLKKVLFAYMNWPPLLNVAWVFSDDTNDPLAPDTKEQVKLSAIQLDLDTIHTDSLHSATSLYAMMHIPESQIDEFNNFLKATCPARAESFLVDYRRMNKNTVDSLDREWKEYTLNKKYADVVILEASLSTDTLLRHNYIAKNEIAPNLQDLTSASSKLKSNVQSGFLFRVQILACREKISDDQLRGIYPNNEKIIETYEDNWYKYSLGTFNYYKDARSYRDNLQIKGAFVVTYYNGRRIKITSEMIK